MWHRSVVWPLVFCSLLLAFPTLSHTEVKEITVRFGVLPVLQALPLFVAQEKGLFSKAGVRVDLTPFNTAAEKDIALTSGNLDGCFGDLVTPAVLIGNGRDVKIVATNYDTASDRRMFGILAKPGGKYGSLKDLSGVPVAVSSNSVIDHVTQVLLEKGGVPENKYEKLEAKNIGMRMQMLLSGQVEAATLPEPLVTAAIAKGAVLLADDAGLQMSQTVLVFSGDILQKNPEAIKAFLIAVNEANELIDREPDQARSIMVEHVRLPEPLKTTYPVPRFPAVHAPDRDSVLATVKWLKQREVIPQLLSYEQVVNAKLVP